MEGRQMGGDRQRWGDESKIGREIKDGGQRQRETLSNGEEERG